MTSLSQRLLHTSLPHRLYTQLGVRSFSVSSANSNQNPTPSDLAHQARLLIQDAPEAVVEPERKFQANQIYPPHSFSPSSLNPPSTPNARQPLLGPPNKIAKQIDPFHASQSDPLDHIFNPAMSRAFVNQMGRIRTRAETGLTWRNQRKVGKLVRRARAMGLISRWTDRGVTDEFR